MAVSTKAMSSATGDHDHGHIDMDGHRAQGTGLRSRYAPSLQSHFPHLDVLRSTRNLERLWKCLWHRLYRGFLCRVNLDTDDRRI